MTYQLSNLGEKLETDVLVVGGGAAGLRAAIEASENGATVTIVAKGIIGKSCVTLLAIHSCNACFGHEDPRDSPEIFYEDTIRGGRGLCNEKLVQAMTTECQDRMIDLEKFGVNWDKKEGKYVQAQYPGHRYPRSLYVDKKTGIAMLNALMTEVKKRSNIRLINNYFVTNLMTSDDGKVIGATAIDLETGEFKECLAKSTILATGGGMHTYEYSSGNYESTGDGFALAYRVGAKLTDMEFVQFFPTQMYYPRSIRGTAGPSSIRYSIHAKLFNSTGERFMRKYSPEYMELDTRDNLTRAIWMEIKAGRSSPHGGVWLDCSYLPNRIIDYAVQQAFGGWMFQGVPMLEFGLDIREVPLEVGPTAHFYMGGIKVNSEWATDVPGLFAAGEVAGGINGANRLAGNALTETQVSGFRAGKYAAQYAKKVRRLSSNTKQVEKEKERVAKIFKRKSGIRPVEARKKLQRLMWNNAGIIRDEQGLKKALEEIDAIRTHDLPRLCLSSASRTYNHELIESFELENMLDLAEMTTKAALLRTESRGAHYRADYPELKEEWNKNITIWMKNGQMALEALPVVKR
jgi:fumarate reductase (CoM/CoB) subunit A